MIKPRIKQRNNNVSAWRNICTNNQTPAIQSTTNKFCTRLKRESKPLWQKEHVPDSTFCIVQQCSFSVKYQEKSFCFTWSRIEMNINCEDGELNNTWQTHWGFIRWLFCLFIVMVIKLNIKLLIRLFVA